MKGEIIWEAHKHVFVQLLGIFNSENIRQYHIISQTQTSQIRFECLFTLWYPRNNYDRTVNGIFVLLLQGWLTELLNCLPFVMYVFLENNLHLTGSNCASGRLTEIHENLSERLSEQLTWQRGILVSIILVHSHFSFFLTLTTRISSDLSQPPHTPLLLSFLSRPWSPCLFHWAYSSWGYLSVYT